MKRIISTTFALFVALAMSIGLAGTAQAAPPDHAGPPAEYTATTKAPVLGIGAGLLYTIEGFGGTTFDKDTLSITAEVIGNPDASGIVIQKGGLTLTKIMGDNAGETLTIKNIRYNMHTGEVTAVLGDHGRVLLYTAEQTSPTTSTLYVAEEGGVILQDFVDFFGLPAIGSEFGTSTLNAA